MQKAKRTYRAASSLLLGEKKGLEGIAITPPSPALRSPSRALACLQMTRDWALCRWFAIEGGVIAIPSSPFFSEENKELGANYVRFAFCKADSTLEEASDKIAQLVEKQRASE